MTNKQKLGIEVSIFDATEIGVYNITDSDFIRFVVEDAGASNELVIETKLEEQSTWQTLKTFTGSGTFVITTQTYDLMRVTCSTFDGTSVKIIASGFFDGF